VGVQPCHSPETCNASLPQHKGVSTATTNSMSNTVVSDIPTDTSSAMRVQEHSSQHFVKETIGTCLSERLGGLGHLDDGACCIHLNYVLEHLLLLLLLLLLRLIPSLGRLQTTVNNWSSSCCCYCCCCCRRHSCCCSYCCSCPPILP
jgi:hypothetical protein